VFANAQTKTAIPAGVPAQDRRVGPRRSQSPRALREFECSAQTIRNWVAQADADQGKRADVLSSPEREELRKLRRENRQLKLEREILAKATAWFARETHSNPDKDSNS